MSQASEEQPLHVVSLTIDNVKRIRTAAIRPRGNTVIISGKNAQGKTSCLDAIEMALGGAKAIPAEPVRHGARKARIVADLGEIVVERTFSAKGSQLEVRGKDGTPKASPQKLLDTLCSKVAFDPLAFARMDPRDQDATLKQVVGLDFSDIEAARAKLYAKRADHNAVAKRVAALVEEHPHHDDVPAEPVNVDELVAAVTAARKANADRAEFQRRIERARADLGAQVKEVKRLEAEIRRLQADRDAAEKEAEAMEARIVASERQVPPEVATDELERRIQAAREVSAKIAANARRAKLERELQEQRDASEECTSTMASLEEERAQRLAAATFPIPGLGFDELGPTLNGVPLAQASQAEKLRLSVAIGAALHPRVRVMLIRDGSLLDDEGMRLLSELAEQTGSQVWIERVQDSNPSAVVFADGEIVGATEAAAE